MSHLVHVDSIEHDMRNMFVKDNRDRLLDRMIHCSDQARDIFVSGQNIDLENDWLKRQPSQCQTFIKEFQEVFTKGGEPYEDYLEGCLKFIQSLYHQSQRGYFESEITPICDHGGVLSYLITLIYIPI